MEASYTVGEFKARFSEVVERVRQGERVKITYGRKRRALALLVPPPEAEQPRQLGRLAGKVKARVGDDWQLPEEEWLKS